MAEPPNQPLPIKPEATSVAAFVDHFAQGPAGRPVGLTGFADFEREFGGLDPAGEAGHGIRQFFLNGGRRAWAVRVAVGGGRPADAPALSAALAVLEGTDFNLLSVPRASEASDESASDPPGPDSVVARAISLCERRRAVLLVDPPPGVSSARAIAAWVAANPVLRHRNAALYYPRLRLAALATSPRGFGASGTIAGMIARVDASGGVWTAPAGVEAALQGVLELEDDLDEEGIGALASLGINCLRRLPAAGIVCWGARTLAGAEAEGSEWKYLPVRRLALLIERSVEEGTGWAVFEPNAEPLWTRLRESIDAFMHALFRGGAFRGDTAQEAFFVRCGADTTSEQDIQDGIVNVVVGFAPLRPAEFVVLRIGRVAGRCET